MPFQMISKEAELPKAEKNGKTGTAEDGREVQVQERPDLDNSPNFGRLFRIFTTASICIEGIDIDTFMQSIIQ